jgi:hypothetical protein
VTKNVHKVKRHGENNTWLTLDWACLLWVSHNSWMSFICRHNPPSKGMPEEIYVALGSFCRRKDWQACQLCWNFTKLFKVVVKRRHTF